MLRSVPLGMYSTSRWLLYQVFLCIGRHGQRSVRDLVRLVLEGSEDDGGSSAPLLALYDWSDAALLVYGVEHVQGLSVRAPHRACKIHHLEVRRQNCTAGSIEATRKPAYLFVLPVS